VAAIRSLAGIEPGQIEDRRPARNRRRDMNQKKLRIEEIVKTGGRTSRLGKIVIWIAVLAAIMLASYFWWGQRSVDPASVYMTEPVKTGDITVTVSATGTVEPTHVVEISSELSGTINSVEADFNDTVSSGQILARLDTEKLEATLERSRASLAAREAHVAEAQATLDEVQKNYDRAVQLERRGIASAQEFASSISALARAKASLNSAAADERVARADLHVAEADLAKACICSPIDGIVLNRNVDVGQIVASSLQAPVLFTIAEDLRRMELRVDIDEADIGRVKVGDKAEFHVEAYQDRQFPAVISELRYASQTIDGVVTYKAILSIDNTDLLLRPGMTATADITVAEVRQALTVSNTALRFSPPAASEEKAATGLFGMLVKMPSTKPGQQQITSADGLRTIWILKDGQMTPVEVQVGETDGLNTQIRAGEVAVGDAVIYDIQAN